MSHRGASAHSQLEAARKRYSAYMNLLSGVRVPADMDLAGRRASGVGGGERRCQRSVVCMPCIR